MPAASSCQIYPDIILVWRKSFVSFAFTWRTLVVVVDMTWDESQDVCVCVRVCVCVCACARPSVRWWSQTHTPLKSSKYVLFLPCASSNYLIRRSSICFKTLLSLLVGLSLLFVLYFSSFWFIFQFCTGTPLLPLALPCFSHFLLFPSSLFSLLSQYVILPRSSSGFPLSLFPFRCDFCYSPCNETQHGTWIASKGSRWYVLKNLIGKAWFKE